MPKWIVQSRIWSKSKECYFEPGEQVEYNDEDAAILVRMNILKPAQVKRAPKKSKEIISNDPNH